MKRETKERLLDGAEKLFAEQGIEATSLRDITAKAKANLAAVHYHFGSKMDLVQKVIKRRIGPVNQERLQLLDEAEAKRPNEAVPLEEILHAFISPMMKLFSGNPHFVRLAGRVHSEPKRELQLFFLSQFKEVIQRFTAAFVKTLPELPFPELIWRLHFLLGSILHTWTNHMYIEKMSNGACSLSDTDELTERLVAHGAATLRAPLPTFIAAKP